MKEIDKNVKTGMLSGELSECIRLGDEAGADAYHPSAAGLNSLALSDEPTKPIRAYGLIEPLYGDDRQLDLKDKRDICVFGVTDIYTNAADRYCTKTDSLS